MSEGLTHAEFEKLVGGKVPAKVIFFLTPERLWFRMGGLWYEGSE